MRNRLIWKILGMNILVVVSVVIIVWYAVDFLAADYFFVLMDKYHIDPKESHAMFVASIHTYLIWGSVSAILLAALLSYVITRRILGPMTQMNRITKRIAAGDYSATVPVISKDEVGELARAFNRMTESLNHMEQLRKTMIVDVTHEFRTPLTNIQGYLEGLMDDVVPPTKQTIALLQEETRRLILLVNDILALARAEGAKINLDILEIHLADAIEHVLKLFRLRFDKRDIEVTVDGVNAQCRVYADPHKLAQLLHNLLQNAYQYTNAQGRLTISAQQEADQNQVRITFANSGCDLAAKDLDLIFERFYRGEKSRSREHGGAGIGLAVVKELVQAHGGQVGAAAVDGDFRLWFTLPSQGTCGPV